MQGFRAIRRDPAVLLLEILWRWSFGFTALLILFGAGLLLLDPVHIDSLARALQTRDPHMIGTALFFTWLLLGIKAIVAVIAVPLAIAIVWTLFVTPARRITARRLLDAPPLSFAPMFALQFVRAISTWLAYLCLIVAVAAGIHFASGSKSDPTVFYAIAPPAIVVILLVWLAVNWHLSVAAIFGRQGQSFRGAIRHARQTVRLQRSDFAGTGFVFLLLRTVALLVALAVCGLTSHMAASAPLSYFTLLTVVSLAYFAVADFLYVARMAAYLALAAAHVDPGGPKLVASSSILPIENSPPL